MTFRTETEKTPVKKSSESSLKRHKSVTPDYRPTPINELKKLKHQETDDIEQTEPTSKRKIAASSPTIHASKSEATLSSLKSTPITHKNTPPQTASRDESSFTDEESKHDRQVDEGEEKPKRLKTSENESTAGGLLLTAKKPSCDLVTFSKLTLSQQVLKRYEMLNKPVPSQSQLVEAKLKKKLGDGSDAAKSGNAKSANLNTPQLILDSAPLKVINSILKDGLILNRKKQNKI